MNFRRQPGLLLMLGTALLAIFHIGIIPPCAADTLSDAQSYDAAGKHEQAALLFKDAIAKAPGKAMPHYLFANASLASKKYKTAISEYSTAMDLEPTSQAGKYSQQVLATMKAHSQITLPSIDALKSPVSMAQPPTQSSAPSGEQIRNYGADDADISRGKSLSAQCDARVNEVLTQKAASIRRAFTLWETTHENLLARRKNGSMTPASVDREDDLNGQDFCIREYMISADAEKHCETLRAYYRRLETGH